MTTILAAVDFSPVTELIEQEVRRYAHALNASVCLVHVAPPEPDFVGYEPGPQHVRDAVAQHIQEHRVSLQAMRDRLQDQSVDTRAALVQGATAEKIIEETRRNEATLIIVGSHGYGAIRNLILGSVSEAVIKDAPCPVLVVPRALVRE